MDGNSIIINNNIDTKLITYKDNLTSAHNGLPFQSEGVLHLSNITQKYISYLSE